MNSNRLTRLLLAAAAVPALTLAITAAPASAVVADSDDVRTSGPDAAFGTGALSAGGVPAGYGRVDFDVAGGLTTPSVIGSLYASPGVCARMRLVSYDLSHAQLQARNGATRCGTVGGVNRWSVNLSNAGHQDTTHVHVIVQTLVNGTWTNYRTTLTDLGD